MTKRRTMLALPLLALRLVLANAAASESAPPQAPGAPRDQTEWDKAEAARYLDDRMDIWFARAKKLRTGEGTASCVSCHTVVPYALARPALRKAMGAKTPTSQEAKLLDEALRRVGTYGGHEPFYKGKEEQSRGTEAVLNLLVLAGAGSRQEGQAAGSTGKALEELWKEQRADGAWEWLNFGLEPYESTDSVFYGATLAAMAVGTANGYAGGREESAQSGVAKLRGYLKTNYAAQNLHSKAWMLLASTRLADLLGPGQIVALTADLRREQNADGGWSLYKLGPWTWSKSGPPYAPDGKPDVSLLSQSDAYATGLVTHALRQAGLAGDDPSVKKAAAWLVANQKERQVDQTRWNCWRTYSLNCDRERGGDEGEPWRRMFMSDGATAFAALALLP